MPGPITVTTEKVVPASAEQVRSLLADYRGRRPQILPQNYSAWSVEEGGVGQGTVFRYHFKAGPRERDYRMRAEEVSDRRLVERDTGSSLVTTWTLSPEGSSSTRVHIETSWQGGAGVGGFFERTFAPKALRGIYDDMLARLVHELGAPT